MRLKFQSDTKHRKAWFTGISFSHPAKMSLPLQLWLIDNYTKVGETILDPLAGSGTILVACSLGRHVIAVDLESKFLDIMKGNWEKIKQRGPQLGYEMGDAKLICGDARNLENILCDKIISSPPYGNPRGTTEEYDDKYDLRRPKGVKWGREAYRGRYGNSPGQIGELPYGEIDRIITSPPYAIPKTTKGSLNAQEGKVYQDTRQGRAGTGWEFSGQEELGHPSPDNIANLPYGQIDKIVTSPPYASGGTKADENPENYIRREQERLKLFPMRPKTFVGRYSGDRDNIGNLPYGEIHSIITSPPYEGSLQGEATAERMERWASHMEETDIKRGRKKGGRHTPGRMKNLAIAGQGYSQQKENIGNLKSDTYLEAMALVYSQCYKVLKPGGLMILVTKNFIRNKKIIRLDLDTIKLCEQAGFSFVERHYRKLTSQSFWRVIYQQKFPGVEQIKYEDILVHAKQ